jgi:hypothetical protein
MRHLFTLIAAVFVAPLSWILLAFGQDRSAQAFANQQHTGAFDTGDFIRPVVCLAGAGLLLGLLATLRVSPLGAVLTGAGYAASYLALLTDPDGVLNVFPEKISLAGHAADHYPAPHRDGHAARGDDAGGHGQRRPVAAPTHRRPTRRAGRRQLGTGPADRHGRAWPGPARPRLRAGTGRPLRQRTAAYWPDWPERLRAAGGRRHRPVAGDQAVSPATHVATSSRRRLPVSASLSTGRCRASQLVSATLRFGAERVEALVPEAAIAVEPHVDLL